MKQARQSKYAVTLHLIPGRVKQVKEERESWGFVLVGYGFEQDRFVLHWEPKAQWNSEVHPWP